MSFTLIFIKISKKMSRQCKTAMSTYSFWQIAKTYVNLACWINIWKDKTMKLKMNKDSPLLKIFICLQSQNDLDFFSSFIFDTYKLYFRNVFWCQKHRIYSYIVLQLRTILPVLYQKFLTSSPDSDKSIS